jgi:hypothetical protein
MPRNRLGPTAVRVDSQDSEGRSTLRIINRSAAMVQEAPLKIFARRVVSYFYFFRTPRARAENEANQQCRFKSSQWCIDPLGTDSCRGTLPMELPMSNGSMRHREPKSELDDTRDFLQGASCTIAAGSQDHEFSIKNSIFRPVLVLFRRSTYSREGTTRVP